MKTFRVYCIYRLYAVATCQPGCILPLGARGGMASGKRRHAQATVARPFPVRIHHGIIVNEAFSLVSFTQTVHKLRAVSLGWRTGASAMPGDETCRTRGADCVVISIYHTSL